MKSINKVLRILQVKRLARARNQEAPKQDTFWNSKPSREKYDITSSTKMMYKISKSGCVQKYHKHFCPWKAQN